MRYALALAALVAVLALAPGGLLRAQQMGVIQSDVLVIDPERMLIESDYGKRLQAELQAERERLIAHNERVAAELEAEEQALTGLRATTPASEFRALADSFDQKVEELRLESERKSRELERRRDMVPAQFMRVVQPVLNELLREANAMVMIDARAVMLHTGAADVTDLAIARVNERIGSGPKVPPKATPDTDPEPAPVE
ncbi:OmpH family outer membrane protein [uncultured Roseovarius sp.]|uniref:OmpH family outer membrane protein n=1 Tax=uncultured Roseovarius sp. TaxID=293344 RepID=UPI00262F9D54|nr:OmpH family outer membrane protein [uncultured Roseovarius sp.]